MEDVLRELAHRIKRLELEQSRQDKDISKLHALEKEILELEAKLQHIDDFKINAPKPSKFTRENAAEVARLQRELEQMEDEYEVTDFNEQRYFDEINQLKAELGQINQTEPEAKPIATTPSHTNDDQALPAVSASGYVICLMYNPKTPTEWSEESGGGWRERGFGECYQTLEKAQAQYNRLKKKWPNHPLKITAR